MEVQEKYTNILSYVDLDSSSRQTWSQVRVTRATEIIDGNQKNRFSVDILFRGMIITKIIVLVIIVRNNSG